MSQNAVNANAQKVKSKEVMKEGEKLCIRREPYGKNELESVENNGRSIQAEMDIFQFWNNEG